MRTIAGAILMAMLTFPVHAQQETTDNPLPPLNGEVISASTDALQATLYDLFALRQAAHQAHWNVQGPDFYQLHEFYEELYSSLDGYIDSTGARMRSLGVPVDARASAIAENAGYTQPEGAARDAETTISNLTEGWTALSSALYERMEAVSDDMPTQDHFIGMATQIDRQLWFLRAHAQ